MRLLYKSGPMESLRKWFYKPKRDDRSLLAQFFFADDALNMVASELDSFDGRKDPERCSTLVVQLRHAQDRVLNITSQIMDQVLGDERVARDFRVKFPEDVLQDNLAGQLWFGAECLAAGSSIMNREEESVAMRPLAKALTRSLETVRSLLREQCLRPRALALQQHDDMLHESLRIFDRLFAEFELCYVSAMVNVKTPHEFEAQQLICMLFSESLKRALKQGLLNQEQVDSYDPALMFAVPRLAIVSGLLIYSSGPLSLDKAPEEMSEMFRPFRTLLQKIRSLLWTLDRRELVALETLLCSNQDIADLAALKLPNLENANDEDCPYPDIGEFVSRFYADHGYCHDFYSSQLSSNDQTITDADYIPDNIEVMPIIDGLRRLNGDLDETPAAVSKSKENIDEQHSTDTSLDTIDTFQTQDLVENSRKTNKSDNNDLSLLRNLSTNGLMMFDPLVINAVSNTTTESNRLLPDQNLVSSLNEQVTEIADRLSSIATNDSEISLEHNQLHTYSTNDVPLLISTDCSSEVYGFAGPRNEQLSCLPSTSHGYLIPNAISQEPVVLASLSHNNSAVFNTEDESNELNGAILNNDLVLMIPDNNIESEIVHTNVAITNANLSSLLLTNEEFRHNFLENNAEMTDDDNNKMAITENNNESVKFMLGYESDSHDVSPFDSGVSTENTSLDRSPDTDKSKQEEEGQFFMKQNRVLRSPVDKEIDNKNSLENSFSDAINNIESNGDVTVNINYVDDSDSQKNEASSTSQCIGVHSDVNLAKDKCDSNSKDNKRDESRRTERDINQSRRSSLLQWGFNEAPDDYQVLDEVLSGIRRQMENNTRLTQHSESNVHDSRQRNSNDPSSSHNHTNRGSKIKKAATKPKKKRSKIWSNGLVILKHRSNNRNQNPALRLDLDLIVNEGATSCFALECLDDEEIALALQAQELAARQQARAKFKSSEDLIHRLFVCIAGVADQLQTNFAADLRNILKSVFLMNQSPEPPETPPPEPETSEHEKTDTIEYEPSVEQVIQNGSSFDSVYSAEEVYADSTSDSTSSENSRRTEAAAAPEASPVSSGDRRKSSDNGNMQSSASAGELTAKAQAVERAPEWVPDIAAADCMRCGAHFTAFRRRHHCRHCGKVFCASCSSNSIPLPRFGQPKPVRVCEECFRSVLDDCRRSLSAAS